MSSEDEENHYQNYSIKSADGTSFQEKNGSENNQNHVDDDGLVYANQSTLDKCKRKKRQVPVTKIEPSLVASYKDPETVDEESEPVKSSSCGLIRCFLTTCGITVLIGSYTFLGAFLFTVLEGPNESSDLHRLAKTRNETVVKMVKARNETIIELATELRQVHPYDIVWKEKIFEYFTLYERQVVWACNHGYKGTGYDELPKWTFKGSLHFVISILTTSGTGAEDMVPQTTWGIVVFFTYTVIGIPLMIIWLVTIGASFAHVVIAIYNHVCCDVCGRCCRTKTDVYRPSKSDQKHTQQRLFVPLIFTLFFLISWIGVGIVVLSSWENIPYIQAAMHIFSIFSTIGFYRKDISLLKNQPGNHNTEKFATFFSYTIFGFLLLAACIRIFYLLIIRCSSCKKRCQQT